MRLMALVFVILICFSVCHATFQRPWQNKTWVAQNPSIWTYGLEIWWNLPELDKTLESIEAENALSNGTAKAYVDQAAISRGYAKEDMRQCRATNVMNPLWALGGPFGITIGIANEVLSEFSEIASCMRYKFDWMATVGSSLTALERSTEEAEKSIDRARQGYEEISFMGLCNRNYTHPGGEHCAEMESALNAVDANITEGKYGKYPLLLEYEAKISEELGKPTPDLSLFQSMLQLVWADSGVVASFNTLAQDAETAKTEAEAEFFILQNSATTRKDNAKTDLHALEDQKLDLVTEAPASSSASRPGSVSERLIALQKQADGLSNALAEARLERTRLNKQNYLANAIDSMAEIDEAYAELISDLSILEEDARETEAQKKTEAQSELEQTRIFLESALGSPEAANLCAQADSTFQKGERAATIGERFAAYSKAAALARAARAQRDYGEQLSVQSSLEELENLIADAEKDEINVITEKESIEMLRKLSSYEVEEYVQAAINSIISKARIKYEDELLGTRERILDKLALAGPAAADLYTDLSRYESGLMAADGSVNYPDAIGGLKELQKSYGILEATLDEYMSDIVGNSMSLSATPIINNIWLDEPAELILDVILTNSRNYAATTAAVKVMLSTPVQFLYSDITRGASEVESLRMEDKGRTLVLVFASVEPFEAKHIIIEKQAIIARTTESERIAEGIGNDAAHITEMIDFELDCDIQRLELPDDYENALIDGADAERPLSAGSHVLTSDYVIDGAYTETINDIKAYQIGTNSRVEYDIEITPSMDLDTVLVFIESINDSRVISLDITAATGELVTDKKRVSATEYAAKVHDLEAGALTVLKVGYTVEDASSFATAQITQLQSANLSSDAEELLNKAKIQAAAGNYSKALELIEQAKAVQKEENKETAKLQKKYDELSRKIRLELEEINASLLTNSTGPLIDSITARKTELERVLAELKGNDLDRQIEILNEVDYKWLDKELTSFKKEAYKEYNELKEQFFNAGNSSTPPEFLEFESTLTKLEAGGRLEYAVAALGALNEIKSLIAAQKNLQQESLDAMQAAFDSLKTQTTQNLEKYLKQASAARGTEYSSMFTETEKGVEKKIKDAGDALGEDSRAFWLKMADLNKTNRRMLLMLESLKNESKAKLSIVESLFSKSSLDAAKQQEITQKVEIMRNMIAAGDYVNALRAGSAIAKELESAAEPDSSLLILAITAIAVLATIAVYIIKQQKEKGEKKPLRKLLKTEDAPADSPGESSGSF